MLVLGADAGGTSLRVALYDGDAEQGRAQSRGFSMRAGDGERLAAAIADLAQPLLLRSRAVRADTLVVGAAGAGREAEQRELRTALEQRRLAWRVVVTIDAELARAAAFGGQPGVLLIAGTGSIAVARDVSQGGGRGGHGEDREAAAAYETGGATRRVGGLGWRMGDQGSAYWIGARGLQAVGAMHDGTGTVTHLAESLCTAAGVAGIAGLVHWSTTASPAQVAALCPAVLKAADRGDAVAIRVRGEAVDALVQLALAAGADHLPVAMSGALIAPGGPLNGQLTAALVQRSITTIPRRIDPCRGAPVLAAT